MKLRLSLAVPLALLALLAGLTLWLKQAIQSPAAPAPDAPRASPDYIIEGFTATRLGADGKPLYTLAAQHMVHFPRDDTTQLIAPAFSQFDPVQPPLRISAQHGFVSTDGEHVYLTRNVVVIREAGPNIEKVTARTESLHLQPDRDLAETDMPVSVDSATLKFTANRMRLDNKNRILKLSSRVKATYVAPR